jgi:carnosine synthase
VRAGIPSRPNVAPRPLRNIAEYSVNALRTGRLKDLSFLDKYAGRADVLYANPLCEAGAQVRATMGAGRGRAGVVDAGWCTGAGAARLPPCHLPASNHPQVTCVADGLPTWICEFMVSRSNIHESIEYVKAIEQEVQKAMVIE